MNRRTMLGMIGGLAAMPLGLGLAAAPAAAQLMTFDSWYTVVNAAAANKLDDVLTLLTRGDNPNGIDGEGRTPLIYAATFGNAPMAKALIEHGGHADYRDKLGNTPLHWAAERGHVEVMRTLLAAKAPVDAINKQGITPLMLAAGAGRVAAVRLLLDDGADPRKQDFTGHDAFGYAARQPTVRKLLQERTR